ELGERLDVSPTCACYYCKKVLEKTRRAGSTPFPPPFDRSESVFHPLCGSCGEAGGYPDLAAGRDPVRIRVLRVADSGVPAVVGVVGVDEARVVGQRGATHVPWRFLLPVPRGGSSGSGRALAHPGSLPGTLCRSGICRRECR